MQTQLHFRLSIGHPLLRLAQIRIPVYQTLFGAAAVIQMKGPNFIVSSFLFYLSTVVCKTLLPLFRAYRTLYARNVLSHLRSKKTMPVTGPKEASREHLGL